MNQREREHHKEQVRKHLTTALFVLDHDPSVSMVQAMLAVQKFAAWIDYDRIAATIREMAK